MGNIRVWTLLAAGAGTIALAAPARADIVVGPRFSYYFDNSNLRTSSTSADQIMGVQVDEEATALLRREFETDEVLLSMVDEGEGILADQIGFPMAGAMVNFGDDRDRFTLTAMYGRGSGDLAQIFSRSTALDVVDIRVLDVSTLTLRGTNEIDKYDFEMTWQRRESEQIAFFAGARYERLDSTAEFFLREISTQNIADFLEEVGTGVRPPPVDRLFALEALGSSRSSLQTFSARAGVTVFVPFGANAVAFANGMVHASYQPDYTVRDELIDTLSGSAFSDEQTATGETSVGPDIAFGAQVILTDNLALDLRYRAILFFPLGGEFAFTDVRANHGVNLGLSLRL